MAIRLLWVFLVVFTKPLTAAEWQNYKDNDGIRVDYIKHDNGIVEVKGSATIANSSAAEFMALLHDTSRATDWLANIISAAVIAPKSAEQKSQAEKLVYSVFSAPWPMKNRDLVSHSCYQRLTNHITVLKIISAASQKQLDEELIRIKDLTAYWLLSEQQQSLQVVHQVYADPNGSVPHWISNKVALKSAYKTLQSLREILQTEHLAIDAVVAGESCPSEFDKVSVE